MNIRVIAVILLSCNIPLIINCYNLYHKVKEIEKKVGDGFSQEQLKDELGVLIKKIFSFIRISGFLTFPIWMAFTVILIVNAFIVPAREPETYRTTSLVISLIFNAIMLAIEITFILVLANIRKKLKKLFPNNELVEKFYARK
jgi:hypothetical protein